jgi:hypothetical protein
VGCDALIQSSTLREDRAHEAVVKSEMRCPSPCRDHLARETVSLHLILSSCVPVMLIQLRVSASIEIDALESHLRSSLRSIYLSPSLKYHPVRVVHSVMNHDS